MKYEQLYNAGVKRLTDAGIDEADSNCFILFSEAFGISRSTYFFKKNDEVPPSEADKIDQFFEWLKRKEQHEPVQYIIGNQDFCGILIDVDERVLIPRLDTEVLVEKLLENDTRDKSLLDLCTGSGCIAIAAKKMGGFSRTVATDISLDALELAKSNAVKHSLNIKFLQGDLFEALNMLPEEEKKFNFITANPPYIAESEKPELAVEVIDHEPHLALFADNDGLIIYERIIREIYDYLLPDGRLYFEIGCKQAEAVSEMCRKAGLFEVEVIKDLAGLDRVVTAVKR